MNRTFVSVCWALLLIGWGAYVKTFLLVNMGAAGPLLLADDVRKINCSSNSMGLTVGCGDKVFMEEIEGPLMPGEIYIYRWENRTIIHRLIYQINDTHAVFKGDANRASEVVAVKNVEYLVTGLVYNAENKSKGLVWL